MLKSQFLVCFSLFLFLFAEYIEQMVKNMPAENEISTTLREIVCQFDEDNQRSSQTFNVGQKYDGRPEVLDDNEIELDGNSFGNDEAWTFDLGNETSVVNESSNFGDPTFQSCHEVFVACYVLKQFGL